MLGTLNGYGFFTDEIIGVKNIDVALIYTIVVASFNKWRIHASLKHCVIYKITLCFFLFFLFCFLGYIIIYHSWIHLEEFAAIS